MEIFADTYTWITISFIGFVIAAYVMGRKSVTGTLDAYVASIRAQIGEAEKLHAEAQEQANEFELKHKNALAEADKIVAEAEAQAEHILENGEKEIEHRLAAREKQLDAEMTQLKENALSELRAHMAKLIEEETQALLKKSLKKDGDSLIEASSAHIKAAKDAA